MTQVLEARDAYRADFVAAGPPWLRRLREAALDCFGRLGFPTLKDEEWRFTNVAPLARVPFRPAARSPAPPLPPSVLPGTHRLVFVNGWYAPEMSDVGALPRGAIVGSLAEALARDPEAVEPHLGRLADHGGHSFTALNTAFLRDGAFVAVPRGQVVGEPIQLLFLAVPAIEPAVSHPRVLIVLGENSQATIVETYLEAGPGLYFTNAVTEVVAGENAVLDHYKLQRESREAIHVAAMQVAQRRGSKCSLLSLALGGALARNEVGVVLDGEGCECALNGLSLASGRQLIDNHTRIDHARPRCTSRELYKAILDGQARGVFSGRIHVHPDAQKTDARQTSRTLLLSEEAVINTQPQLEIYADDVKCTHGAAVGQLDPEALFYLRSRGIGAEEARALLTYAFANEVVGHIRIAPLREQIEGVLSAERLQSGGRR